MKVGNSRNVLLPNRIPFIAMTWSPRWNNDSLSSLNSKGMVMYLVELIVQDTCDAAMRSAIADLVNLRNELVDALGLAVLLLNPNASVGVTVGKRTKDCPLLLLLLLLRTNRLVFRMKRLSAFFSVLSSAIMLIKATFVPAVDWGVTVTVCCTLSNWMG